jgi:hypothetical protein
MSVTFNNKEHIYIDEKKTKFKHNIIIDNTNTSNANLEYHQEKKLKYKNNYYKSFPLKGTCYNMGVEDWTDWFTIPYYYINNNYQQGSKNKETQETFTISQCYIKCKDNFVINKNNISLCEDIKTFNKGKYKDFIPFDPFAIICIIGSKIMDRSNEPILLKSYDKIIYDNRLTIKDKNDIEISNYIEACKNHEDVWSKKITDMKTQVQGAYEILDDYINNNKITHGKTKVDDVLLNNLIKFYELFDKNDEYYKYMYLKKIGEIAINSKNNDIPVVIKPHYYYAYYIANKYKDYNYFLENIDTSSNADTGNIKHIERLFINSINLCLSSKYVFCQRLIDSGIIKSKINTDDMIDITSPPLLPIEPVELKNNTAVYITSEYNINDIKIEKENIEIFGEYKNVNKHFQSLIMLAPFLLVLFIIPFGLYAFLLYFNWLSGFIKWFANFTTITFSLIVGIHLPYYLSILLIFIAGKFIIYPLYLIILKIPLILSIIAIGFIISLIDRTGTINKFGKVIYGYAATFLFDFLNLILDALKELLGKKEYIIPIIYIIYTIIYYIKDEILIYGDPNLDTSDCMLLLEVYKDIYIYKYLENNIGNYINYINYLKKNNNQGLST